MKTRQISVKTAKSTSKKENKKLSSESSEKKERKKRQVRSDNPEFIHGVLRNLIIFNEQTEKLILSVEKVINSESAISKTDLFNILNGVKVGTEKAFSLVNEASNIRAKAWKDAVVAMTKELQEKLDNAQEKLLDALQ